MGKLFFTLLQIRTTTYLIDNRYLNISVHKAFFPKTAGCVEHTQTLAHVLKDAQNARKAISAVFIDLKNAYGSVRHALIIYALKRYHLPPMVINMLISYYDLLVAIITTPNFNTKWLHYSIGLFQGCTLSTTLFNMVYNLLDEWMSTLKVPGYVYKDGQTEVSRLLFADDTTFINGRCSDAQATLNHATLFFNWTITMKARPNKCVALVWARVEKGHVHKVQPLIENKSYAPLDAQLKLQGEVIPPLYKQLFKFLGR